MPEAIEGLQPVEREPKPGYSFINIVNRIPEHQSLLNKDTPPNLTELDPNIGKQLETARTVESLVIGLNAYAACAYLIDALPMSSDQTVMSEWVKKTDGYVKQLMRVNNLVSVAAGDVSVPTDPNLSDEAREQEQKAGQIDAQYKLKSIYLGILGSAMTHDQQFEHVGELYLPKDSKVKTIEITSGDQFDEIMDDWNGLVHDIRTPMTSVNGYTQIVSRRHQKNPDEPLEGNPRVKEIKDKVDYLQNFLQHDAIDYLTSIDGEPWDLSKFGQLIEPILIKQLEGDIKVQAPQLLVNESTAAFLRVALADKDTTQSQKEEIQKILNLVIEGQKAAPQDMNIENSPVAITVPDEVLSLFRFHSAETLLKSLLANTAWNLPKTFDLKKEHQQERDGEQDELKILYTINERGNIEIILRDNGYGLSDKIEEEGFGKGRTAWGESAKVTGTGIGLASAARRFGRTKFKTELKAKSLKNGDQKVGADIILEIPIDKKEPAIPTP